MQRDPKEHMPKLITWRIEIMKYVQGKEWGLNLTEAG